METRSIKEHPRLVAETLIHFIRSHGLRSGHYFGLADRRVILALKAELGFEFGVTDYYDRWNRAKHFWSDEFETLVGPGEEMPDWLEGVTTYFEGAMDTNFLIYDLPPSVSGHGPDLHLGEFFRSQWDRRHQEICFVALLRNEPSQLLDELQRFEWKRLEAGVFGFRKAGTFSPR